jgi:hypothetical protein
MSRLPLDLSCRELVELVTDYLEERLSADDRTRFQMHLVYCDSCRTYLHQMRQVLATTGKPHTAQRHGPGAGSGQRSCFLARS